MTLMVSLRTLGKGGPMSKTDRHQALLAALAQGEQSTYALALLTDSPEASVRRDIQQLRAAGYRISYSEGQAGGYRLF
jgi:predicted DNA-binding transcriptional regulator YafY